MTTYISLPPEGSPFWEDPVTNVIDLPLTDRHYTIREVTSTKTLYVFDGATWSAIGITSASVSNTNSVDLTVTAGVLTADINLSSDVAGAGYILGELAIRSGGSPGLRSQIADSLIRGLFSGTNLITYTSGTGVIDLTSATIYALFSGTSPISFSGGTISIQVATAGQNGYLSSADWTTFNSKEPAIAAGTTSQYWRGDKSFQTLNIAALQAITDGSSASLGQVNEILTASQATNTTTGIAVSGSFGSITSVSLTAGRWRIQGIAGFNENGATLTTALQCGISASATGSGIDEFDTTIHPYLISSTSDAIFSTPSVYVTLAGTTTYYLNSRFYYTSGTPQHRGKIVAERIG